MYNVKCKEYRKTQMKQNLWNDSYRDHKVIVLSCIAGETLDSGT